MFVPSAKNNYVVKAAKRAHKDVFSKPVPYSRPIRYDITDDGSRIAACDVFS
jgi:hypothetical protein